MWREERRRLGREIWKVTWKLLFMLFAFIARPFVRIFSCTQKGCSPHLYQLRVLLAVLPKSPGIDIHQSDWSSPPFLLLTPPHDLPNFLAALQDTVLTKHHLLAIFAFGLQNLKPASLLWQHEMWKGQTSQGSQDFSTSWFLESSEITLKLLVWGGFICFWGGEHLGDITQSSFQILYRGWCCCLLTASPWARWQWPPSPW